MHLGASLSGLGGKLRLLVFALPLSEDFSNYNITQLEMLNVLVAIKVSATVCTDKKIKLSCDNLAVG